MEQINDAMGMLDLMVRPGFCVKDQKIVKVNQPAQCLQITEGMDVTALLHTGKLEYSEFQEGCLYLTLNLNGQPQGASVTRMGEFDVFLLEQEQTELQAMALAARELRAPLSAVMNAADRLFPMPGLQDDPAAREQMAWLNQGLFQLLRIINNMSDASRFSTYSRQEILDIAGFLDEVFAKAQALVSHAGIRFTFQNISKRVFCLADGEQLGHAVLNLISNAVKFSPEGGTIEASVTHRGKMLYLSIQDSGEGIPDNLRSSIYSRYLRQPVIEDGRYGIGLGLVLVRAAAANHGGTVLIDHPGSSGTRITMSLAIRQSSGATLRAPSISVDYSGGRDRERIDLADVLPVAPYDPKQIN